MNPHWGTSDKKSEISQASIKLKKEHAYEKNGAVWLESTKFGDDKDRVIIEKMEEALIYQQIWLITKTN